MPQLTPLNPGPAARREVPRAIAGRRTSLIYWPAVALVGLVSSLALAALIAGIVSVNGARHSTEPLVNLFDSQVAIARVSAPSAPAPVVVVSIPTKAAPVSAPAEAPATAPEPADRCEPDSTPDPQPVEISPVVAVAPDECQQCQPETPVAVSPAPTPNRPAVRPNPAAKPDRSFGTAVEFAVSPVEAAKKAAAERKLVFVLHVSGNFEKPEFT